MSSDPAERARRTFLICSLCLLPVAVLAIVLLLLLSHPIGAAVVWGLFAILTVVLAVVRSWVFREARAAERNP